MKKVLIITTIIILVLGVIGGNVSSDLGSILLGMLIISLGIFNLVIWYIIKRTFVVNKAYLLDVKRLPHFKRFYYHNSPDVIVTIQYNFNDKEYITQINVKRDSLLANRDNVGKVFDIYMSEKFPKVVVDKIENNSAIYITSIILFICGLFITMVSII